jgi:hypothetical protein
MAARAGGWEDKYGPECALPEVEMIWGAKPPIEALLRERPRDGELWYPDEPSRFGALARLIWDPVAASVARGRW